MANLSYQQDGAGNSVAQTQTGPDGAADVYVKDGVVAIMQDVPGQTNGIVALPLPVSVAGPLNASTIALAASLVVKPGAGRLFRVNGTNTKVSAQFIQVFDAASLPAEGAVPKVVISVAASTPYSIDFGIYGRVFTAGIVVCNSSTAATKTIGSADITVDAQYV